MKIDLDGPYTPDRENEVYQFWEEGGYFNPDTQVSLGLVDHGDVEGRFCLTLPPPNVTGALHLGHAITIAIEDFMARYNRLLGKETLFLPGSDHAGIATQNVVERELLKKGIKRKELGRKKFIEKVWEWKHEYHARITEQSKRLGMSSDWSRERFTLDDQLSDAVRQAFVSLYKKGLIYRGTYMVNWCPGRCESAISDLEAIPREQQGNLWYIKYPLINEDWKGPENEWGSGRWAEGATEFIEVATTRPETLLGDTGIATTENHEIYGKLVGREAILPVLGRQIPIFSDPHVDPEFGTGAVKVTPAHDPNDYEMGRDHDLEFINVLDENARMVPEYAGKYANMDRYECREAIVNDLDEEGLLIKIEPHVHSVARCQRCDTIVEPRVSMQWFVKAKPLAAAAMEKVRAGITTILPDREEKRFFHWMENIRDWCISRQLWWGHRIPVWYCEEGHQTCELDDPITCAICGNGKLKQDEDVLDTWFSSGLWPFSTLGWPDETASDFNRFYPTNVRETGYDILFFWVAREMMLGIELTGHAPYEIVYMHGIVRNEKGKKISKSMENIEQYDPLNIITKYGADVLRYTLVSNAVPGRDINLDPRQFEAAKRLCNKIWNSTKFVLSQLGEGDDQLPRKGEGLAKERLLQVDRWILSRLNRIIKEITSYIEKFDFLNATREMKNFFWGEFCDWYIEATKIRLYDEVYGDKTTPKVVLLHVINACLTMFHPVMPYLTEILWQSLPGFIKKAPALIIANWPDVDESMIDENLEENFTIIMDLIREIRRLRKKFNVPLSKEIPLMLDPGQLEPDFEALKDEICTLAKINPAEFQVKKTIEPPKRSGRIVMHGVSAYLPLEGLIDLDAERERISKQIDKIRGYIEKSTRKLDSPFSEKADPEIVQKEREKLASNQEKLKQLEEELEILK
ncbi:valine--tRNA ligase [Candidatus Bathyarchaeota archaeon]|nr:valine--tRNA ligase [Candidatus Bathyarchaeota archaeon]